jgi:methylmalonyl-CoA/ethylmalonyl-CoA epimerase
MDIDHVNIATPDAEASAERFRELFGLEVARRITVADQGVNVVKLAVGDAFIEFTEPTGPDTPVGRFLAKNRPGLHHLCLRVPDLGAAIARLKQQGAALINEEPTIGAAGLPVVFVHPKSCSGVLVELVEAAPR